MLTAAAQLRPPRELSMGQKHLSAAEIVHKHWGDERWLVPEGCAFGFKVITVRSGMRTSLHYHRVKEEANLVLCGEGALYLADDAGGALKQGLLVPGHIAHIRARTVHRVEATTDLVLVEVSTPELDDIVRLEDDLRRGDGRIAAEHLER